MLESECEDAMGSEDRDLYHDKHATGNSFSLFANEPWQYSSTYCVH